MKSIILSTIFIVIIGISQIFCMAVLHDWAVHIASEQGASYRGGVAYGITLEISSWIFVTGAFAVPFSLLIIKRHLITIILLTCLLLIWSYSILPAIHSYPHRATFLYMLGPTTILGGALITTWIKRFIDSTSKAEQGA